MPSNPNEYHNDLRKRQERMRESSYNRILQRSGVSSLMPQEVEEKAPASLEDIPQEPINWLDKIRLLIREFNDRPREKVKIGPLVGMVRGQDPKVVKHGGIIK